MCAINSIIQNSTTIHLSSARTVPVITYALDIVNSTQTWSKEHLKNIPIDGWMTVIAKTQTGGMGTNGRTWYSPKGNIYASFTKQLPKMGIKQLQIPQIVALAVAQTIEEFGLHPQLKWINDVLLNRKKISGILVEVQDGALIIGIGLNVNLDINDAKKINKVCFNDPNIIPITSLLIETGHKFNIENVFQTLQQKLYTVIDLHFNHDLNFIEEIESRLICKRGDNITIEPLKYTGIFKGLNSYGAALIEVKGKGIIEINTGRIALPSTL